MSTREAFEKWWDDRILKGLDSANRREYEEAWQAAIESQAQASEPVGWFNEIGEFIKKPNFVFDYKAEKRFMESMSENQPVYISPPNTQQKLDKAREALQRILDDQRMAEMTTVSNAYLQQNAPERLTQASEPVAQISVDKYTFKYVEWLVDSPMQHFCYGTKFYTSPPNTQAEITELKAKLDELVKFQSSADKLAEAHTEMINHVANTQQKLDKAREALELYARRGWETGWEHAVQTLKEIE
jgi:hypothetical protein